jgi:catechol 2,3-dioxygenase-like lactoylglutathione lyase family enzyme
MSLHRLTTITIGVPNVAETAQYYAEFGLGREPAPDTATGTGLDTAPDGDQAASFSTGDGGVQLRLHATARRRLVELRVGADDPDDIARVAASLARLDLAAERTDTGIRTYDPGTEVTVVVEVAERIAQADTPSPPYNTPGHISRPDTRAPGVLRQTPVRPRKLGHVVLGSTDQAGSQRLFTEGLGFKISDTVPGLAAFMRCSTDHHNVLVQQAPLAFLHHTSWQVNDVDEVGRGATSMLAKDPGRHVWGLGRHHVGSNFFWYLRDPAGNFSEYYSDLDCIVDDELWTPQTWEGARGLYNWGPPPPPSFLAPDDLAELMTGVHGGS